MMTTLNNPARYTDLLRAIEGLRNLRAIFLLALFGVASVLLAFLGGQLSSRGWAPGQVFFLPAMFVMFWGISAVGCVVMAQTQGLPPRALLTAVVDGLMALLRIGTVALIGLVVVLAFYLCMAAALFVCKIPALGPVVYALLFPLLSIVGGFLFLGLFTLFSMVGPAVWSGARIPHAVAMLWQIAVQRALELLFNLFLLFLLLGVISGAVFGILSMGALSVSALSAPILGNSAAAGFFGGVSGYGAAARTGVGLLFVLAFSALFPMWLMGVNLIYLKLTADLDPAETERLLDQRLAAAKQKARSLKEESQRRMDAVREAHRQRQEEAAAAPAKPQSAPVEANARVCPQCQASVGDQDRFCGECGAKL
jgi:hypothetical protein